MSKLFVTFDNYFNKTNLNTFVVYDFENKTKELAKEKINELDCQDLQGKGRPTFRPFGITGDDNFLYVASNNKLGQFCYKTFDFISLVDIPLFVNTHQIIKDKDTWYTCNTSIDNIGIYNDTNKFLSTKTLDFVLNVKAPNNVDEQDSSHVNSLCKHDGKIYFCLHNKNLKMSEFGYFDIATYEIKIFAEAGYCCHNIIIRNNKLYTLSTHTGEVIEIDLETNQVLYYKVTNPDLCFMRGLDIYDKYLVIGFSNNIKSDIDKNYCAIHLFDTKEKSIVKYFDIDDNYVITDLKIIH